MGPTPGEEPPITPGEPGVLDAGDVVDGVGGGWLGDGLSSATGCVVVFLGKRYLPEFIDDLVFRQAQVDEDVLHQRVRSGFLRLAVLPRAVFVLAAGFFLRAAGFTRAIVAASSSAIASAIKSAISWAPGSARASVITA